jgi:uncharacterized protein
MSERIAPHLGDEKFVSLTTFKRYGDAIASPMWIVRDGEQLSVWTPADASKVKRVRRDPRVTPTPRASPEPNRTSSASTARSFGW